MNFDFWLRVTLIIIIFCIVRGDKACQSSFYKTADRLHSAPSLYASSFFSIICLKQTLMIRWGRGFAWALASYFEQAYYDIFRRHAGALIAMHDVVQARRYNHRRSKCAV